MKIMLALSLCACLFFGMAYVKSSIDHRNISRDIENSKIAIGRNIEELEALRDEYEEIVTGDDSELVKEYQNWERQNRKLIEILQ